MSGASLGTRTGTVRAFDSPRGLGTIAGDDGREYPFHCSAVADGSREIDEGATVSFAVTAGPAGRWEATGIEPA